MNTSLCEVFVLSSVANRVFDSQQQGRLPIVERSDLIEISHRQSETVAVVRFAAFNQLQQELALALCRKRHVQILITLDGSLGRHQVLGTQMTNSRLKEQILGRVFQQIIGQIRNSSLLINLNRTSILFRQRAMIGHFQLHFACSTRLA
jgi:hypothetical protein